MKLRVKKFLKFELKVGVNVLCGLLIFINIGIVIYGESHSFQRTDSRFLQIVFSFVVCPIYVLFSVSAFIGAQNKEPDLLLPLMTLVAIFNLTLICSPVLLIIYCSLADIEESVGRCILTIIITFGFTYTLIWLIVTGIMSYLWIVLFSLYKTLNERPVRKRNVSTIRLDNVERKSKSKSNKNLVNVPKTNLGRH